jgi:hypothetical protein
LSLSANFNILLEADIVGAAKNPKKLPEMSAGS